MPIGPPDPECWLRGGVEVGESSIAGRGLFTRVAIPGGTVVSRVGGRLVGSGELRRLFEVASGLPDRPYVDTIAVAEDAHLILAPGYPNRYGNHGCDPNLWWAGPYTLIARRTITAGEELLSDYATGTGDPAFRMGCSCGSALCRGVVTGRDWLLPELRQRYGDHWVPVLLARIRRDDPR